MGAIPACSGSVPYIYVTSWSNHDVIVEWWVMTSTLTRKSRRCFWSNHKEYLTCKDCIFQSLGSYNLSDKSECWNWTKSCKIEHQHLTAFVASSTFIFSFNSYKLFNARPMTHLQLYCSNFIIAPSMQNHSKHCDMTTKYAQPNPQDYMCQGLSLFKTMKRQNTSYYFYFGGRY
jgi:hypothetical protein